MAITGNKSTEKTVREKTIYTGLADCEIISINPSLTELKEVVGINAKHEPQYLNEEGTKMRLDFWVRTTNEAKAIGKLSLWLENTRRSSKDDKPQWINAYGRTAWAFKVEETLDWFLKDDVTHAFVGEEDLHKLLQAFLNVKYNTNTKEYNKCKLDTMENGILKGDISEIKNIFMELFNENTVRLLWGAKVTDDGKVFQNIHNSYFEKTCVGANYTNWNKNAIEADYGAFKADIQDDFNWQPYTGTSSIDQPVADSDTPSAKADVTEESETEDWV